MAKRWPDEQEADTRRCTAGEVAKITEALYLHRAVRRRSDRHKREGGCAIPGEI
jgi:hypothetical protein